jgi:hypothetical protein
MVTFLETESQEPVALVQRSSAVPTQKELGAQFQQSCEQRTPYREEDYYLLWLANESMLIVLASTISSSAIKFEDNKQYIKMEVRGVQKKCRILMKGKDALENLR